jgi:uncharacterized protein (DUF488 family)
LKDYKDKKVSWEEYEKVYFKILEDREVLKSIDLKEFEDSVLLCSEPTATMCHRRLLAEYIQKNSSDINIKHL